MQPPHENPSAGTDAPGLKGVSNNAPISHVRSEVLIVLDSLYGEGPPVQKAQVHLLAEEGFHRGG